jgi:hypothetical protein
MPDVALALVATKQPMTLALLKKTLEKDKDSGRIAAPGILQRGKPPKFEGKCLQFTT